MGADTETHKGYARLLCIEGSQPLYQPVTGNWEEWIEYLLNLPTGRIAFFNLRFDVEAILKHFPEQFIKNLLYLTEAEIQLPKQNRILTFKLIPWKLFTIREMSFEANRRRTKRRIEIFEAAQFFQTSLNNASKEILKEEKIEDQAFAQNLNETLTPWQNELPRIIQYCQDDAIKAGRLIRIFMQSAAAEPINLAPKNPISCAWYAKELIRQCVPEVKTIKSIRTGQGHYYARPWKRWDNVGSQCYVGGRFEPFQKGTFDHVYNDDINSAYPDSIAKLPNPYNLTFVKDYQPEGEFSMVKADVVVPKDLHIGPLPFRMPDTIIFPVGSWTGWFHWDELRNAEKYGVEFDISKCLNGFEPDGKQRPFANRIPAFYEGRKAWKKQHDPRQLSSKIAMNSVYGVFYEKNERIEESESTRATEIDGHHLAKKKDNPGRFFYPYLAGKVTSECRVKLLNAAMQKPESIIFLATDGILSTERLNIPISDKMGDWSRKECTTDGTNVAARVFGNGLYELGGKIKTRGFRKDKDRDPRPMRERMRIATAKDKPNGHQVGDILIETIEKGPIHLATSFKLRDYSLKDALTWIEKKKEMNITQCKKRIWPKFTVNDLYSKSLQSKVRLIDGNPFNINPGIAWKGDEGQAIANRFALGAITL
jgi:hypothetical protein